MTTYRPERPGRPCLIEQTWHRMIQEGVVVEA